MCCAIENTFIKLTLHTLTLTVLLVEDLFVFSSLFVNFPSLSNLKIDLQLIMDTVNAVSNPFLPLLWASKFGFNVAATATVSSPASTGNTNVATLTADQLPTTMADMGGTFPWNLDGNSSNHSSNLSITNRPDSADAAKLSANAVNVAIGQAAVGKQFKIKINHRTCGSFDYLEEPCFFSYN